MKLLTWKEVKSKLENSELSLECMRQAYKYACKYEEQGDKPPDELRISEDDDEVVFEYLDLNNKWMGDIKIKTEGSEVSVLNDDQIETMNLDPFPPFRR